MFQSSQSNAKQQQSGQKNYQNRNDTYQPMTVKMVKEVKNENDQAAFQGTSVSYVSVVGRVFDIQQPQDKHTVVITDDSGFLVVALYANSRPRDLELLRQINNVDEYNNCYYKFIIMCVPFQKTITYNLQFVHPIREQNNEMLNHFINICLCQTRRSGTALKQQPQTQVIRSTEIEEEEFDLDQLILNFTKSQIGNDHHKEIPYQQIVNQFKSHQLPNIKKALNSLKSNALLVDGQNPQTYKLP